MKKIVTTLAISIAVIAAIAAATGILSDSGAGMFVYESIRGRSIEIYGKGIYRHMSADVAIQGIAQDYVTLFLSVPLLLISLSGFRKQNRRAHFLLTGTFGYFLVTYLFYTTMGMYNVMFLCYVVLLGLSFFGFYISCKELFRFKASEIFSEKSPTKFAGWLLVVNSVLIGILWLTVILPPLFDGTLYPKELNHFTTLIVQGLDLGLLLPICFVVGVLLVRRKDSGYFYGTIYLVFLSLLMTALTAKVIAMGINDVNVIPAIFIIPSINIVTILATARMMGSIKS